jgi:hypothetical protein
VVLHVGEGGEMRHKISKEVSGPVRAWVRWEVSRGAIILGMNGIRGVVWSNLIAPVRWAVWDGLCERLLR